MVNLFCGSFHISQQNGSFRKRSIIQISLTKVHSNLMNHQDHTNISNDSSISVEKPSSSTHFHNESSHVIKPQISINNRFMTIQSAKGDQKCQISLFQVKIYECLMNEKFSNIMCWTNSGTSFQIKDVDLLERKILPSMFKHCLFSSFQRQLHAYGFKKIYNREGMILFRHTHFIKNKFASLKNIKRKNSRTTAFKQVIEIQKHKSLADSFGAVEKSKRST